MLHILLTIAILLAAAYLFLRLRGKRFEGEDLSRFDSQPEPFATAVPSDGLKSLNAYIKEMFGGPNATSGMSTSGWEDKRKRFDAAGLAREYDGVEFRPDTIAIESRKITGAWTLPQNYDPNRRLLYMHGGAFTVGSDVSHRPLTAQLARRTGMAVFAPNYRLMPENSRRDTIHDARDAYKWILENGPDGKTPLNKLALAGDSAGGNLVLMLSNWARHHVNRQPDAVVAFSPTVDTTFSSPSIKANLKTDLMLRPMLAAITKAPRMFLLPTLAKHYGMSPADPNQSPIFDDLSGLPPTLIQASDSEILYDDSVRFVAKAKAAESPVSFQSWSGGLPHVWQIFDDYIPEASTALDEIEVFLAKYI